MQILQVACKLPILNKNQIGHFSSEGQVGGYYPDIVNNFDLHWLIIEKKYMNALVPL